MSTTFNRNIAAAERKTGFSAFRLYLIGAFFAGLYIFFISIPMFLELGEEPAAKIEKTATKGEEAPKVQLADEPEAAPIMNYTNLQSLTAEEGQKLNDFIKAWEARTGQSFKKRESLDFHNIVTEYLHYTDGKENKYQEALKNQISHIVPLPVKTLSDIGASFYQPEKTQGYTQRQTQLEKELAEVKQFHALYVANKIKHANDIIVAINRSNARALAKGEQPEATTTAALISKPEAAPATKKEVATHNFLLLGAAACILMFWLLAGNKYGILRLPRFIWSNFYLLAIPFLAYWWFSINDSQGGAASLWAVFLILIVPFLIFIFKPLLLIGNEAYKEWELFERITKTFSGRPTGRWGGVLSNWHFDVTKTFNSSMGKKIIKTEYSPLIIGKTLLEYDYRIGGRYIGTQSEQHLVTVAGSGAGKSYTMANNVLSSYCGGMVILDPKAEHTKNAYDRRKAYAPCHVIDPFGMSGKTTSVWNVLEEIDPKSDHARSDLEIIASGNIIEDKNSKENPHFREVPKTVLIGIMAHVLTTCKADEMHLGTVYDYIVEIRKKSETGRVIFEAMQQNDAIGGAPIEAADEINGFTDKSGADHWSSLMRGIKWMNDPAIRKCIAGRSNFSLADCKTQDATVFLSLPENKLKEFNRFSRVFFSMALLRLNEVNTPQPKGSKRQVLFVLDEFSKLGNFEILEEAYNIGRSSNIKIWILLQNLGQLTKVYSNAMNFLGNSDLQAFGISKMDKEAKEMLSEALGSYIDGGENIRDIEIKKPKQLMTENDISNFLDAEKNYQLFLPYKGGYPMRLARVKTI